MEKGTTHGRERNKPHFLLENEYVKQSVTVSPSLLSTTKSTYYITNKRVIKKTSKLTSDELEDIPLDEIISVDDHSSNVIAAILGGVVLSAFLSPVGMMIGQLSYADVELNNIQGGFQKMILELLSSTWHSVLAVSVLIILLSIISARASGFEITTANPNVSMKIQSGRTLSGQRVQDFVQEVRKEARRDGVDSPQK